jgi:DnaB-like helicase N terminal domain
MLIITTKNVDNQYMKFFFIFWRPGDYLSRKPVTGSAIAAPITDKELGMKQKKDYIQAELDFTVSIIATMRPQATEPEEAVTGAIILEKDACNTVMEIIKPECFYVQERQLVLHPGAMPIKSTPEVDMQKSK